MTNTTNYNLLLAEGTDLVNYLTQTNPNFSNLDTIIKGVSDLTVTPATEVTTGTAHAISKTLADATVIKFTATSNWLTGDTMTLDGSPVTPLKTDGTTLKTGDYIIGSAVLMIQDGTRLTVLVASSPDASDINYTNDGTHTWLTANKVEGAINEAATEIDTINSNLSAHDFGTTINISTYIEGTNEYTCLSDGYCRATSGGLGTEKYMFVNHIVLAHAVGDSTEPTKRISVFVKKGMILATNSGPGSLEFIPLT